MCSQFYVQQHPHWLHVFPSLSASGSNPPGVRPSSCQGMLLLHASYVKAVSPAQAFWAHPCPKLLAREAHAGVVRSRHNLHELPPSLVHFTKTRCRADPSARQPTAWGLRWSTTRCAPQCVHACMPQLSAHCARAIPTRRAECTWRASHTPTYLHPQQAIGVAGICPGPI